MPKVPGGSSPGKSKRWSSFGTGISVQRSAARLLVTFAELRLREKYNYCDSTVADDPWMPAKSQSIPPWKHKRLTVNQQQRAKMIHMEAVHQRSSHGRNTRGRLDSVDSTRQIGTVCQLFGWDGYCWLGPISLRRW